MTEQVPSEVLVVGDIGIITRTVYHHENLGRECLVIMPLDWYKVQQTGEKMLSYKVELDGRTFLVRPQNIRKKRPPRKDREIVRWNDCPWQPESLRV